MASAGEVDTQLAALRAEIGGAAPASAIEAPASAPTTEQQQNG